MTGHGPVNVVKGTRVYVERFVCKPIGTFSIAGAQPKVVATKEAFEGVVTHIRGDHPTAPTVIELTVMKDDGVEVTVDSSAVKAVIAEERT